MKLSEQHQKQLIARLAIESLNSNHLNTVGFSIDYIENSNDKIDPEFHFITSPLEGKKIDGNMKQAIINSWKGEEFPFPVIIEDMERRVRTLIQEEKWADLYEIFGYHPKDKLLQEIIFDQMSQKERENIDTIF